MPYTLLDGQAGHLGALRGKVVLVTFWASDCAPCVADMPALAQTWRRFAARDFGMLAVAVRGDPPMQVVQFARERALPFPVTLDLTGAIAAGFGDVRYTPTTILVDRAGRIVGRWVGAPDFDALQGTIDRLLAT